MTNFLEMIIGWQKQMVKQGMQMRALAVEPTALEQLKDELTKRRDKLSPQDADLVSGIQLVPWYPETQRLQARMAHLNLIQHLGAFLKDNGIGVNRVDESAAPLTPEEYEGLIYKFLGVDQAVLQKEQDELRAVQEAAQDAAQVTTEESVKPEVKYHVGDVCDTPGPGVV